MLHAHIPAHHVRDSSVPTFERCAQVVRLRVNGRMSCADVQVALIVGLQDCLG